MATIQGVYVALFGRPADPAGLAYFNGVTNNGANLSAIGNLAATTEYTDRFKTMNNTQIVNSIYQSLFGRDAEAAGLAFFVDALNKGTLTINNIAINILDGAQGADKTTVDAKIASANIFTAALDTPAEQGSYAGTAAADAGRAFLADVTTTAKTAAQADTAIKNYIDSTQLGTTNLALTVAANDVLSTTSATATLKSTDKNDTITAAAGNWVAGDKIDGGFGVDTFNATLATSLTVATDGLKNVEILNITADDSLGPNTPITLDLTNATGVTQVWNKASADSLTVSGIALSVAAGITGTGAGTATFAYAGATGSSDAASLAVDAGVVAGVTIAAVETLNISNKGTSDLNTLTVNDAKSIVLTGTGSLALDVVSGATTTVDASAFTGTTTLDVTAADKLVSVLGGTNNDAITIDTHGLTANVTINGGAGVDVLTVASNVGAASAFSITLTGGAGADNFKFGDLDNVQAVDTNANLLKSLVTISDFDKAADVISFTVAGGARDTLDTLQLSDISDETDLLAAATKAATYTTIGEVSLFVYGADSYALVNNGGQAFGADDGLVKIAGVTNLADFTATNFLVA